MRLAEYTLSFEHIEICKTALAHLAMRERVFLYSLVYSLAPRWILEIGTFKGGSAQIISGALDDLALDGKLITIDPHPEQIDIDGTLIAHNCTFVQGFFPKDIDKILPPGGELYGGFHLLANAHSCSVPNPRSCSSQERLRIQKLPGRHRELS